jgi:dephospho-CoA kinase
MHHAKIIGLVGGIASGKSRVGQMLVELGAGLLDADRCGHSVLTEDAEVRETLRRRWGDTVFARDGSVDRALVAKRVFAGNDSEDERQFLEDLLHPRIRRRLEGEAKEMVEAGRPAIVVDAPLLLEAGWKDMCDLILMIDSSRETRLARARQRGWTDDQFAAREAAQWPIRKKHDAADAVIDNDGSEEQLHRSVRDFWDRFIATAQEA